MTGLLAEFLPYIVGALVAVGAVFGYGRSERKKGRKEQADKMKERDRERAMGIRRDAESAFGLPDDNGGYRD